MGVSAEDRVFLGCVPPCQHACQSRSHRVTKANVAALRLGKQTGADHFVIEIIGHNAWDFRQFGSLALPTDEQELVPTENKKGRLGGPFVKRLRNTQPLNRHCVLLAPRF
jgi:hypothetical protein